ncbi:Metallothionein expression activator [Coniosporium apollinis]|uniref:Metallothionein expression activator n=1 Tax=Coniosporium apollinis TaxID=61459 RepID=A0ABQ9NW17_9PEZI|nr:Metallothionein expression activator [Coniosporium apollinis]
MQVAQQQRPAQPGPPFQEAQHYYQQQPQQIEGQAHGLPCQLQQTQPRTSPQPSPQQIQDLEQHIKSVYGPYGTVYVNILPTPQPAPQKPAPAAKSKDLDFAPMPTHFDDLPEINLEPSVGDNGLGLDFKFEIPESDIGYESSYYSEAVSPGRSPSSSPAQRDISTFLDGFNARLSYPAQASLLPTSQSSPALDAFLSSPSRPPLSPRAMSITDISLDATIEDTGISPEEVQQYISEQDPENHRWTCLFPECGKTFGRRENIRSHVQTHLGDRQFRCNGCGKCFVRQHDLKRHSKIHTGDKPYKCPCGGGFARQDALTRHRQRGMCVGGFPNAVRQPARRGRPKKKRPDLEERLDKASKTRRALASTASSYSDSPSPEHDSPGNSSDFEAAQYADPHSFEMRSDPSCDPFGFNDHTSPFASSSPNSTASLATSSPFDIGLASDTLFRLTAEAFAQTPPTSPKNAADADSQSPASDAKPDPTNIDYAPFKTSLSSSKPPSNPFTTPPTSPAFAHADVDAETDIFADFDVATSASSSYDTSSFPLDDALFDGADLLSSATDFLGSPEGGYSAEEAMGAGLAWIDAL